MIKQLEEINARIVGMKRKSGMPTEVLTFEGWQSVLPVFTKDLEYLQEQAERAQGLEVYVDENSKKSAELNLFLQKRNATKCLGMHVIDAVMKYTEDLEQQNKRYRELIKEMSQEIEVLTDVMSNADNADELNFEVIRLKGALEDSE